MKRFCRESIVAIFGGVALLLGADAGTAGQFLIVGVDQKLAFTREGIGRLTPGQDSIVIYDISWDPLRPEPLVDLALENSWFGPPTNLGITPDGGLALVANSVMWEWVGSRWESPSDQTIHVIDMNLNPPRKTGAVTTGDQPSGLAISRDSRWVAVANRKGRSVSVFEIRGGTLVERSEIAVEGEAVAVSMNPTGTEILVAKFAEHAVGVVRWDGRQLRYEASQDLAVGLWPYNIQVVPGGKVALVANNGNRGMPDGHVDTVSVLDLSVIPHRVINHVVVGDGPEGLAVSPDGRLAVVTLSNGAAPMYEGQWYYHDHGRMDVLSIRDKTVKKIGSLKVGRFAAGVGFSLDGRYLYVGDLLDRRVSIWEVEGEKLTDTRKRINLPGPVVSLRTQIP